MQSFDVVKEAKDAAKEFFQVAYETANIGAHSIVEGKIELLYDYIFAFEDSDTRVNKDLQFIVTQLGTNWIGSKREFSRRSCRRSNSK